MKIYSITLCENEQGYTEKYLLKGEHDKIIKDAINLANKDFRKEEGNNIKLPQWYIDSIEFIGTLDN